MRKRILIWFGWLILLWLLTIFTSSWVPFVLLFPSLLLPGLTLFGAFCFRRRLSFWVNIAETGEKQQKMKAVIGVKNKSIFPFPVLRPEVTVENYLTAEEQCSETTLSVMPKGENSADLEIAAAHCGKLCFSVKRVRVCDFFGVFGFCLPVGAEGETVILPSFFPMEVTVAKTGVTDPECDTFSPYRSGNDPSETFSLRDYEDGDPLRSIHWKLTGKFDRLMIREASLPLNESVLLLLERIYPLRCGSISGKVGDSLGEIIVSLSQRLTEQGCRHSIGWIEPENKTFVRYCIDSEETFQLVLPQILAAKKSVSDEDTVSRYLRSYDIGEFANIVYISPVVSEAMTMLPLMQRKTEIICSENDTAAALGGEVSVYGVTPQNYASALYEILI